MMQGRFLSWHATAAGWHKNKHCSPNELNKLQALDEKEDVQVRARVIRLEYQEVLELGLLQQLAGLINPASHEILAQQTPQLQQILRRRCWVTAATPATGPTGLTAKVGRQELSCPLAPPSPWRLGELEGRSSRGGACALGACQPRRLHKGAQRVGVAKVQQVVLDYLVAHARRHLHTADGETVTKGYTCAVVMSHRCSIPVTGVQTRCPTSAQLPLVFSAPLGRGHPNQRQKAFGQSSPLPARSGCIRTASGWRSKQRMAQAASLIGPHSAVHD